WLERWQARLSRQQQDRAASVQLMQQSSPSVIPRNHRVEEALEAAGEGDYTVLEKLLAALADPYAYSSEQAEYCALPALAGRPYRTYCGT
ncbi:MAG: protein ydiU, partial [Paenibacillus sp.]|nr:protein ydiU [Paenibacillus sp.]